MKYLVDIDGVLCENGTPENYVHAIPKKINIDRINNLFDSKNEIVIYTSRLHEDRKITIEWLDRNAIQYHSIIFDKPSGDYYIDDKAIDVVPGVDNVNEDKLVICMSGGLDSASAYYYALEQGYKNIKNIFFDINQPYVEKELDCLNKLNIPYQVIKLDVWDMKNITPENYIIRNRNSMFANAASVYGNRIWIVGLKYENHYLMHDKNDSFYRYISLSLSQSIGENIIVETPYKHWSKTDIFKWLLERGRMDVIENTTSCYHPTKKRCGECSLCFKRWVSEKANNIDIPFDINPIKSNEGIELVKRYKKALKNNDFTHYSYERINETLNIVAANE